jgi:hypothetical protein
VLERYRSRPRIGSRCGYAGVGAVVCFHLNMPSKSGLKDFDDVVGGEKGQCGSTELSYLPHDLAFELEARECVFN